MQWISSIFRKCLNLIYSISKKCIASKMLEIKSWHLTWGGPSSLRWKCQSAKIKEGLWYTGKIIRQMWAEWAVYLNSYLWKGWMFYLSMGKKRTPSRSRTIPDRWYWKFFFFWPTGTSNDVCIIMSCSYKLRNHHRKFKKWWSMH